MKGTCYIIGAGDVFPTDVRAKEEDYIICADGGYKYSGMLGRQADLVVGDFDSFGSIPETENKIVAPAEKDETDMTLAIMEGHRRGYRNFVIFGALGGERFDHTVANLQLLSYICKNNSKGTIIHNNMVLAAFSNDEIIFSENHKGYISVFSLCDESRGVTIENLRYTVKDYTLKSSMPLGVSNEFVGKKARISVEDGTLLVICNKF
ncbi:MAG: thiamine diphosphokinase [Clostridia bacterium]|nr:thiamine diphosphokinase [Clostridia bacterium]